MASETVARLARWGLLVLMIGGVTLYHVTVMPDWLMDASMSFYVFPVALGAIWWGAWAALLLGLLVVVPLYPHMITYHGALNGGTELVSLAVIVSFAAFIGWRIAQQARERRWLSLLHGIAAGVTRGMGTEEIVAAALDGMAGDVVVRAAWVYLVDDETQRLRLVARRGLSEESSQALREGASSAGGAPPPAGRGPLPSPANAPRRMEVPLEARGQAFGVLGAELRGWRWQRGHVARLVQGIAGELAVAIDNRNLYEQERSAARDLRESELRYRELFDRSPDAVLIVTRQGIVRAANEAAHQLVGDFGEGLVGGAVSTFLPELSLGDPSLNGRGFQETRLLQQGGDRRDVEAYVTPLAAANRENLIQLILHDVTEQRLAEAQVRHYAAGITRAQEEERRRIGRELHDDTVQHLMALSRRIDALPSAESLPESVVGELHEMEAAVQEMAAGLRRFSQNLRPSVLDDLGLPAAVEWLTEHLTGDTDATVTNQVTGTPRRLAPEVEVGLFRIVQEALNNALRHAGAQEIRIVLSFEEEGVRATVSDDGRGFEVSDSLRAMAQSGHLGLLGMKERADLLGARLQIQSALGVGTVVSVELPIGRGEKDSPRAA